MKDKDVDKTKYKNRKSTMINWKRSFSITIFMCLFINIDAAPQEQILEHERTKEDAAMALANLDPESIIIPAECKECSVEDKNYCLSDNFTMDHCCCQKNRPETLEFVAHQCYESNVGCQVIIADCNQFELKKSCCCDKIRAQAEKAKMVKEDVSKKDVLPASPKGSANPSFNYNLYYPLIISSILLMAIQN